MPSTLSSAYIPLGLIAVAVDRASFVVTVTTSLVATVPVLAVAVTYQSMLLPLEGNVLAGTVQ